MRVRPHAHRRDRARGRRRSRARHRRREHARRARRVDLADGRGGAGFAMPHGWAPFRTFFGGLLTTCGLEHTLGPRPTTARISTTPGSRRTSSRCTAGCRRRRRGSWATASTGTPERVFCAATCGRPTSSARSLTLERELRRRPRRHDDRARRPRAQRRVRADAADDPLPRQRGWPVVGEHARGGRPLGEPRVATKEAAGRRLAVVDAPSARCRSRSGSTRRWPTARPRPRGGAQQRHRRRARRSGCELAVEPRHPPAPVPVARHERQNYVIGLEPGNARSRAARARGKKGRS